MIIFSIGNKERHTAINMVANKVTEVNKVIDQLLDQKSIKNTPLMQFKNILMKNTQKCLLGVDPKKLIPDSQDKITEKLNMEIMQEKRKKLLKK